MRLGLSTWILGSGLFACLSVRGATPSYTELIDQNFECYRNSKQAFAKVDGYIVEPDQITHVKQISVVEIQVRVLHKFDKVLLSINARTAEGQNVKVLRNQLVQCSQAEFCQGDILQEEVAFAASDASPTLLLQDYSRSSDCRTKRDSKILHSQATLLLRSGSPEISDFHCRKIR